VCAGFSRKLAALILTAGISGFFKDFFKAEKMPKTSA
jgi:hypothetical protein